MSNQQVDVMAAIRQIAAERKIDVEEIVDAIKEALKFTFKELYPEEKLDLVKVVFEPENGVIAVFVEKTVVKTVKDESIEISLNEAGKANKKVKMGDKVDVDITPEGDFGRIAAQTARQVILQKLRESEKESAIKEVEGKIGNIESVVVQRILPDGSVLCEINRARALMPKEDKISNEFYKLGSRIKVLLKGIDEDTRGKYVLVSRSAPEFLQALFNLEVPEIESGTVEIMAIAREAGSRSKVAVRSNSDGVDPIGSCVGQKGVRINAIMNELKFGNFEEKIDIILWDEDENTFIMNAIRPAEAIKVEVVSKKEKKARVMVPAEQQSLAIGKEGQNARLAKKLTGWEIDIEPDGGSNDDESAPTDESVEEETGTESESTESVKEEVEEKAKPEKKEKAKKSKTKVKKKKA